jgi:hypothetical protein
MYLFQCQCGKVLRLSSKIHIYNGTNTSVMIQKLDKRALALRLFGRDIDEFADAKAEDKNEGIAELDAEAIAEAE